MKELILGIDTSERRVSSCVLSEGKLLSEETVEDSRSVELLLPTIQSCLSTAGISSRDLTGISVSTGPGSFTGLRSGIATAQGLSANAGIAVLGVSSLLARLALVLKSGECAIGTLKSFGDEVFCSAVANKNSIFTVMSDLKVCTQAELAEFKADIERKFDGPVSVVALDTPAPGISSGAAAVAGIFLKSVSPNTGPQFQIRQAGLGLEPLYGKQVQAKTLEERGK